MLLMNIVLYFITVILEISTFRMDIDTDLSLLTLSVFVASMFLSPFNELQFMNVHLILINIMMALFILHIFDFVPFFLFTM